LHLRVDRTWDRALRDIACPTRCRFWREGGHSRSGRRRDWNSGHHGTLTLGLRSPRAGIDVAASVAQQLSHGQAQPGDEGDVGHELPFLPAHHTPRIVFLEGVSGAEPFEKSSGVPTYPLAQRVQLSRLQRPLEALDLQIDDAATDVCHCLHL